MIAVKFSQQTHTLAENQPEYTPLPVHIDQTDQNVPMTCCFELSDEEIAEIVATKRIWHTQLTFGNAFQPIMMTTRSPFEVIEAKEVCTDKGPEIIGEITKELAGAIHEAIGAASMCWEYPEKAGVFNDKKANGIALNLMRTIAENTKPKI